MVSMSDFESAGVGSNPTGATVPYVCVKECRMLPSTELERLRTLRLAKESGLKLPTKACRYCGSLFTIFSNNKSKIYCNDKCQQLDYNERRKEPKWIEVKVGNRPPIRVEL